MSVIGVLVLIYMDVRMYKTYMSNYNSRIGSICSLVADRYPDISPGELMTIINDRNTAVDEKFFSRYGIDISRDSVIVENDRYFEKYLIIQVGCIAFSILAVVLVSSIYNCKRRNDIAEIAEYISNINRGNYVLKIDNNSEDELSILKNEVYKTMIMLKEAAEHSKEEKKLLKDALSDISHQLKTPITSVMINLDNMSDNPDISDEDRKKLIRNAKRDVKNISFLVQNILKLSRFEADTIKYIRKTVSLESIIDKAVSNVEALADLKGIELKVSHGEDLSMTCDPIWQTEAVTNIIKNAIEHAESRVDVYYESSETYSQINISNDGEPVDESDMLHLFERFYRGKHADSDSVGIGLALAKAIIDEDNGYIKVYNCDENSEKSVEFVIRYLKN